MASPQVRLILTLTLILNPRISSAQMCGYVDGDDSHLPALSTPREYLTFVAAMRGQCTHAATNADYELIVQSYKHLAFVAMMRSQLNIIMLLIMTVPPCRCDEPCANL